MAHIENFNQMPGAIFNDNSQTLNIDQRFSGQSKHSEKTSQSDNNVPNETAIIKRCSKVISKVDLYRVIMAMIKLGCFESADGSKLGPEKVFSAFGRMLGDNFDSYANDLSAGSNIKNEIEIFKRLENAFNKYEADKLEKKLRRI